MRIQPIFYVYPVAKLISFRVIAEEHVKLLRRYYRVETVDQSAFSVIFPMIQMVYHAPAFIHPYFTPFQVYRNRFPKHLENPKKIIGVEVADSDHITPYAVELAKYVTALIVPSNFSRNSFVNSGVKNDVIVVPHGVGEAWINAPPQTPNQFKPLADLKLKRKTKLIQCWILYKVYRKGLDLLISFYNKLVQERQDTILVLRNQRYVGWFDKPINPETNIEQQMAGKIIVGWLTEKQKMGLFDIADMYMLTSRGGGFEHPPLEALARGEIVLGAKGGAWEDYLPNWALIPSHKSDIVVPNNPIHDGYGVELDVDKAVDKTVEILDNIDEYKAKVREHINTHVKQNFTWEKIGTQLKNVVERYLL